MARQKEIKVSSEGVNCFGFRLLSSGLDRSDFDKNPIMLWNHNRSWKGTDDEVLPIGKWEGLRIDGTDLYATPNFDSDDEFAAKIENKYKNGFIKAASVGFKVVEQSNAAEYILAGQTHATVTKWKLQEISICDIPANPDAVCLYDDDNNIIQLNADNKLIKLINIQNSNTMTDLEEKALIKENAALKAEIKTLKEAQEAAKKTATNDYLNAAVLAGKIAETEKANYAKLMNSDEETTRKLIDSKSTNKETTAAPAQHLAEQLRNQSQQQKGREDWTYLDWGRRDPKGLKKLSIDDPDTFNKLKENQINNIK